MPRIPWSRDELLLACALVAENDWAELRQADIRVTELSELLRALPLHRHAATDPRFRSPNSVSRKTTDIATIHPDYPRAATKGGRGTRQIVADFLAQPAVLLAEAEAIRTGIGTGQLQIVPVPHDEETEVGASEGRLLARWATYRERSPGLRQRKIDQVRRRGQEIRCEVCGFDFREVYGRIGADYIEVHHTLPLHISGPRETKPEDLALLCSNCHRMCHRSHRGASWRTPAELRAEMNTLGSDRPT
ncbi:HNH endonuclease [Streptomyces sp. NPDC060194]|uniref:HNH endonuclease n=1 Tax=Streptomyces sp. NPDC060194 TaxID=3347069 RepID=UPI0036613E0D